MTTHKWQFAPRFKRNAYGWKSDIPIQRIKEALAEIKAVSKKEPVLAAEGAVLFLEKLSPAIEHVDSSSGAIGGAVNRAIDTLAPLIGAANVDERTRGKWLDRLWTAFQDDAIPYLESLADHWGALCRAPQVASGWADELKPIVESVWAERVAGRATRTRWHGRPVVLPSGGPDSRLPQACTPCPPSCTATVMRSAAWMCSMPTGRC